MQLCPFKLHEHVQLSEQFIHHFARHLKSGPVDPLVVLLRNNLTKSKVLQRLCLNYLIGSVAISGQVDPDALRVVCELCGEGGGDLLPVLSAMLFKRNCLGTVVRFMTKYIKAHDLCRPVKDMFSELMKYNASALEKLALEVLDVLTRDPTKSGGYEFVLRQLPVEWQYRIISTCTTPPHTIINAYSVGQADPLLREIFLMARLSADPNPQLRREIGYVFPYFNQFLLDRNIKEAENASSESTPALTDDALHHLSGFVDVETLLFVLPQVCKSWCKVHQRILAHDRRVHDLYLLDLSQIKLEDITTIMPWRYCLKGEAKALVYFGRCLTGIVLEGIKPELSLQKKINIYMKAVVDGIVPPPKFKGCVTEWDDFVRLFERVYELCADDKPILDKPKFASDEEYEQAIYYLVHEKKLVPRLPESLIADNMPRLFSTIKENGEILNKLIPLNFGNFVGASVALIVYGQTNEVPDKLAQLIFSQTDMLEGLVGQGSVLSGKYYDRVVESEVLPKLLKEDHKAVRLCHLLFHLTLSFKEDPAKIDKIVASMASQFPGPDNSALSSIKWWLPLRIFSITMGSRGYSPEDIRFFDTTMARCGLM